MIKKRENFLSIAIPDITEQEIYEVIDTLKSGWLSVGPKVKRFEEKFAEYQNVKYAIAVSSATAGLFLAAKVLGIKRGDFVIVPTITWPSTANIVEQLEAIPIFVDVEKSTLNTTPELVENEIKKYNKKIKLIIPVHMSGLPVDIDGFQKISQKYHIPILYDAAHAVFSEYRNKKVGGYGIASCFSFYAIKNITTGDGGMVTTNDDKLAEAIRLWSYHGMSKDAWKRYSEESASPHVQSVVPGYKFNMTDIHAAIGLAQLQRAKELLARRNKLVQLYNDLFKDLEAVETPIFQTSEGRWANHVYTLKLKDEEIDRNKLMKVLREYNIGTNIHFYPVHLHYYYRKKYPEIKLPNAEWLGEHLISLPLCTRYGESDIQYVVEVMNYIIKNRLAVKK
ncbi:MAG: DegT/DnrJ/EryC1/StrS aminotransferase family protein [candidate division WOR-3 bacterium]